MKRSIAFLASIPLLLAFSWLSACSVFTGADSAAAAAVQGGIELITSLYITHKGGGTAAGEAAVAQQVAAIATSLEGVATGNLTVAQFNAALQAYIAKLSPAQQIIAVELLTQIDLYFAQQVANKGSILNAQTVAAAQVVLNDIIAACSFYLQTTAAAAAAHHN